MPGNSRNNFCEGDVIDYETRPPATQCSESDTLREAIRFVQLPGGRTVTSVDAGVDVTIDATDPKSGTAEFKASAVRIEKIEER